MKGMTLKEKLEHIWEYYRPHIFTVAAIITVAAYLLSVFVLRPSKTRFVSIYFLDYVSSESMDRLAGELDDALVENKKRYETYVTTLSTNEADPAASSLMSLRFETSVAAGEVDLVFSEAERFEMYAHNGYFDSLVSYLSTAQMEALEDSLVWYTDEEGGEMLPLGLRMDGNTVLEQAGITPDLVVGVAVTASNEERINDVLSYLFQ